MDAPEDFYSAVARLSQTTWTLATLGAALEKGLLDGLGAGETVATIAARTGVDAELVRRMLDVLAGAGLVQRDGDAFVAPAGLAASLSGAPALALRSDLRCTILQSRELFAAAMRGRLERGWQFTDPEILEAQGAMSAPFAGTIVDKLLPEMPGLATRFSSADARFLDVGAGVAKISIELCRRVPRLRVLGLEPQPAPMSRARANVAEAGLSERIELREQRIEDLTERDAFDLVWMPAPFLPNHVLRPALARAFAATRPGGWIVTGAYRFGDTAADAVLRLRTVLSGGDAITADEVIEMVAVAGYEGVRELPAPPRIPARMIVGRRPA